MYCVRCQTKFADLYGATVVVWKRNSKNKSHRVDFPRRSTTIRNRRQLPRR